MRINDNKKSHHKRKRRGIKNSRANYWTSTSLFSNGEGLNLKGINNLIKYVLFMADDANQFFGVRVTQNYYHQPNAKLGLELS